VTPLSLGIFASANQSAAATSFESIATVTVGSGGSSSISFTSISGTYAHLQLRIIANLSGSTTYDDSLLSFNSDTATNYAWHRVSGNGSTASANAGASVAQARVFPLGNDNSSAFNTAVIDILDYANTNKYKTIRSLYGYDANGVGEVGLRSSLWMNTNAVTSITITPPSTRTFTQYSHFALYGIKSA
jgi:hypothetical protein